MDEPKKCRHHIGYDENGYPETCDKLTLFDFFGVPLCEKHYGEKIKKMED